MDGDRHVPCGKGELQVIVKKQQLNEQQTNSMFATYTVEEEASVRKTIGVVNRYYYFGQVITKSLGNIIPKARYRYRKGRQETFYRAENIDFCPLDIIHGIGFKRSGDNIVGMVSQRRYDCAVCRFKTEKRGIQIDGVFMESAPQQQTEESPQRACAVM